MAEDTKTDNPIPTTTTTPVSPRGQVRPRDGRGQGTGNPGGLRGGRNEGPCKTDGPGFGQGQGQGQGQGRNREK